MSLLVYVKKCLIWGTTTVFLAIILGCSPQVTSSPSSSRAISTPAKVQRLSLAQNPSSSVHLTLGNPSNASSINNDDYLMQKPQYVLSYNKTKAIPNWVSWQLNQSWLGEAPRQNDFRPDDALPSSWDHIKPSAYTNSGYDKGHMTPSADRTKTVADNSATFLLTNILPQAPDNNQGPWADLEDYCRDLVNQQNKELYIISGGYGAKSTIAKGKVTVPANIWKVIVILDRPGLGVKDVTTTTRVIAVIMPNSQGIRNNSWKTYRTTVHQIETATSYNLLSNVPVSVQNVIENRADNQ